MNTAVIVSLDYLLCQPHTCEKAWKVLYTLFLEAGFELHERMFIQPLPAALATPLAARALAEAADELEDCGIALSDVIKGCVTFEYDRLQPLATPAPGSSGFDVAFMETGAFPALRPLWRATQ